MGRFAASGFGAQTARLRCRHGGDPHLQDQQLPATAAPADTDDAPQPAASILIRWDALMSCMHSCAGDVEFRGVCCFVEAPDVGGSAGHGKGNHIVGMMKLADMTCLYAPSLQQLGLHTVLSHASIEMLQGGAGCAPKMCARCGHVCRGSRSLGLCR